METIGKFFVVLILIIFATLLRGYIISKLWFWFVVPTFALNPLTIVQAIGLSLIISYVTISKKELEPKDEDFFIEASKSFMVSIILAIYALFTGWIITLFM